MLNDINDSPAYVTSICLHPRHKGKWTEKSGRTDLIERAKIGVSRLWEMADLGTQDHHSLLPKRHHATRLDAFIDNDLSDSDSNDDAIQDEYYEWMALSRERSV